MHVDMPTLATALTQDVTGTQRLFTSGGPSAPSAISVFGDAANQLSGSATSPVQADLTSLSAQSTQLGTTIQQTQSQLASYQTVLSDLLASLASQLNTQA